MALFPLSERKRKSLFFDIEAGGLYGEESSILSASWSGRKGKISSLFATPAKKSKVSLWAQQKVLEPLKSSKVKQLQEQHLIEKLISRFEQAPIGSELAGWNIGYYATPQLNRGEFTYGFDLPMLATRAGKYGLEERLGQAVQRLNVRDIGQEYAWKIASELQGYSHLVDKGLLNRELFEQASAYRRYGLNLAAEQGLAPDQIAKAISRSGIKMAGWKQETVAALKGITYGAHQSSEDVGVLVQLAEQLNQPVFRSETDVVKWGKLSLKQKLLSSLMSPSTQLAPREKKYQTILDLARAQEYSGGEAYSGFTEDLLTSLKEEVRLRGGSLGRIQQGYGLEEKFIEAAAKVPGKTKKLIGFNDAVQLFKKNPLEIMAATAVVGGITYAAFSAFDDDYNTVPGLRHGGLAAQLRKENTDFGSGYQGQDESNQAKTLFNLFTTRLDTLGTYAGTGHKRILIPEEYLTEEDVENKLGFTPVLAAIPETGQTTITSWRHTENLYHLHKHNKLWTLHEDEAVSATMLTAKLGNPTIEERTEAFISGLPHLATEGLPGAYYYTAGVLTDAKPMTKRLLDELQPGYLVLLKEAQKIKERNMSWSERLYNKISNFISGKDDNYNTIEGLRHGGIAQRLRRENTDFGSGWRGLLSIPKNLAGVYKQARGFKEGFAELGTQLSPEYGTQLVSRMRSILGENILESQASTLKKLEWGFAQAKRSNWSSVSLVNIGVIETEAARRSVQPSALLKATITHERTHQSITELALREKIVPGLGTVTWKEGRGKLYRQVGATEEQISEEYLADVAERQVLAKRGYDTMEAGETYHTVSPMSPMSLRSEEVKVRLAAQKTFMKPRQTVSREAWQKAHKEATLRATVNGINPGNRHRTPTGKIII